MPAYPRLLTDRIDFAGIQKRVDVMAMLGVPYGRALHDAPDMARTQAREIAAQIVEQGGPGALEDKEVTALVAYLQRLGTDLKGRGSVTQASATAGSGGGEQ